MSTDALIADRFELLARAGAGGMGTVYRANDRVSGRLVAVKIIDHASMTDIERFQREAMLLASLGHPGIVRYIAHGAASAGRLYLAMELLEGEPLDERLSRAPLSLVESVAIVEQVAAAIGHAHAHGVVHRDIKPANLFLVGGDPSTVKVLDFGIARVGSQPKALTATGVVIGTPQYMAPEQARGQRHVGACADVFSLGSVWFECLTGRPAFGGDHVMAVLAKILLEPSPRVRDFAPNVPAAIEALVEAMLAKDPGARPADANAVLAAIQSFPPLGDVEMPMAAVSPRRQALTEREQRLMSIVFARPPVSDTLLVESESAATLVSMGPPSERDEDPVADIAKRLGARIERLADGSTVAVLTGTEAATDLAARAARCALALRDALPNAALAIVTGRGDVSGGLPVGEVIDRGVCLIRSVGRRVRTIALDEATAGLLDSAWDIGGGDQGLELRGERERPQVGRTLLGRETPCVGRDREIQTLLGLFESAVEDEQARFALVTGEAGVGKSRVRFEFVRRVEAHASQPLVLIGRGDPMSAGAPYALMAPVVRRLAGILDGERLAVRQQKLRARVARHVIAPDRERVTAFLGEMIGTPFDEDSVAQLRSAHADPLVMGDQMRRALIELLAAECRAHPVVLVLEDLHWGDAPSVAIIEAAERMLRDSTFVTVAFARPEVRMLFPDLFKVRDLTGIGLAALSRKASEKLVRAVLPDASDETVQRIVLQSDGNAFYLEELIRAVAAGRDELPSTVTAMVQSRLETLSPEARRAIRAASVFGESFWLGGVHSLLGTARETRTRTEDAIEELASHEFVVRRGAGAFARETEYVFRHSLLREAAYAMLTEEDRALGHRLAGEWLEQSGAPDAMLVASHFERGGEATRAIPWFLRAAQQALDANDHTGSAARALRGIECGAQGEVKGSLLLAQAEASFNIPRKSEAVVLAREALTLLHVGSPAWLDAVNVVGRTISGQKLHAEGSALAMEVLGCFEAGPAQPRLLRAAAHLAFGLMYLGVTDLPFTLLDRVIAAVPDPASADPLSRAHVHLAVATIAMRDGDLGTLLEREVLASEALDVAGDRRSSCAELGNVGYAQILLGLYADAEKTLTRAAERSLTEIQRTAQAASRQNLGLCLMYQGRLDEAVATLDAAAAGISETSDPRLIGGSSLYLAQIAIRRGDTAAALEIADRAMRLLENTGSLRPQAFAVLSQAQRGAGRVSEALANARHALVLMQALELIEEGESFVWLALAEALTDAGASEEAQRVYAEARASVDRRASRIRDESFRRAFLERVPENAVIVARASGFTRG